jgi:alanyl aminopeptidase
MLDMFEQWMGPETFRQGVLAYLNAHAWGLAEAKDLWGALSQASGRDVAGPMSTFLDQPGVPLVEADILDGGAVRFTQRRFLNFGAEPPSRQLWQIPIRYKYYDGERVHVGLTMLSDSDTTVTIEGGKSPVWIHPNADESGYYRWYVGPETLQRLTDSPQKSLTVRERVGVIDNSGALLVAGVLHGDRYLRLIESFANDPEPSVDGALARALNTVKRAFIPTEMESSFAVYVRRVLGPSLRRIGFQRPSGEAEAVSLLRPQLVDWLADDGQDEAVLTQAEALARSFRNDRNSVDPSLVETVVRLSALRGDATLFDEYRKRLEESRVPTDRTTYLQALGSFREAALRKQALDYALSGALRPHEILLIPRVMAGVTEYQEEVFLWMTTNYATIVAKIPPAYGAFLPYVGSGCLQSRLDQQRAFFSDPAHVPPGADVEFKRIEERTEDCIGLRDREGAAVDAYLNREAAAR